MCPWYNEELIAISENDASRCKALYSALTDGGENADPAKIPTGLVVIKSAWPGAAGELLYCGGTMLNAERRHALTWVGGGQPPTTPPGGELWDIQPTETGHYTIKSAWPGAAGELLYCGGPTLNAERRHVLTWVGGGQPPTAPSGGELWEVQPSPVSRVRPSWVETP